MPHDIIIVQKLDHLPARLQEFLHSKGFASQTVASYKDIYDLSTRLRNPIIILEGGATDPLSEKIIDEFLALPFRDAIIKNPVLFIGSGERHFEEQLAKHFKLVTSLDLGCGNNEILEALEYIAANFQEEKERIASPRGSDESHSQPASYLSRPNEASYSNSFRVPNLFFQELERTGLTNRRLNGDKYFSGQISVQFLKDEGFFEMEPKTLEAVHKTLDACDNWTNRHLCRSTFMAQQIADAMNLDREVAKHLSAASFLFGSAVIESSPSLMRTNYLRAGRGIVRKDLGSRIKDSALAVSSDLSSPELGSIIAGVGRLIAGEISWQDTDTSLAASCIMLSD